MWIEIVTFFLGFSLLLYCLFAGADFGAGILEIFLRSRKREDQRELISHAMGPVWEANHVWLILAVVILFMGFPRAYTEMSIRFHIPLTLILIGVIMRGCAFSFRSYDPVIDRSHFYYSGIFRISSVLTPLMLGVIAGAAFLGKTGGVSFYDLYVSPWFDLFTFSIGIFTCALFAFLASVYLIGEGSDPEVQMVFVKRAKTFNIVSVLAGALVFISAQIDGFSLIEKFASDPVSLGAMALATFLLIPIWRSIHRHRSFQARFFSAAQVALVLIGWFKVQFPVILASADPTQVLTIYNSAAPEAVLRALTYALLFGSLLIFPALFYLIKIFKYSEIKAS
jgi:cytochrome d ubiquinol oxidase subunit II